MVQGPYPESRLFSTSKLQNYSKEHRAPDPRECISWETLQETKHPRQNLKLWVPVTVEYGIQEASRNSIGSLDSAPSYPSLPEWSSFTSSSGATWDHEEILWYVNSIPIKLLLKDKRSFHGSQVLTTRPPVSMNLVSIIHLKEFSSPQTPYLLSSPFPIVLSVSGRSIQASTQCV